MQHSPQYQMGGRESDSSSPCGVLNSAASQPSDTEDPLCQSPSSRCLEPRDTAPERKTHFLTNFKGVAQE